MHLRHTSIVVSIVAAQGALLACSSGTDGSHSASNANGTGAGSSTGATDGAGASLGAGSSNGAGTGASGSLLGIGGSSSFGMRDGGALAADAACAASVLAPEAVTVDHTVEQKLNCTANVPEPIAIYIVLDNSLSMKESSKWTNAVAAINRFVKTAPGADSAWKCVDENGKPATPPASLPSPSTGSISVALQYFHPKGAGASLDECDGTGHAAPAVPMAALPGNAAAIASSLTGTSPKGNTPTVGALTGGTEYCQKYEAANPGKKCALVLVTDGQPNGCGLSSQCADGSNDCVDPNSATVLSPIAQKAHGDPTNPISTFTVGMSGVTADGFALLDAIAIAGGADCTPGVAGHESCDVTTSGADGLLAALDTIRKSVQLTRATNQSVSTQQKVTTTLACQWSIPKPTNGQTFDKNLVNISYSMGGKTTPLGNVATQADCAAASSGWYYDDAGNPSKILVCPDTCTTLQGSTDVSVRVLVGCSTVPAIIR